MEVICNEAATLDFCTFGLIVHVCVRVDLQWSRAADLLMVC